MPRGIPFFKRADVISKLNSLPSYRGELFTSFSPVRLRLTSDGTQWENQSKRRIKPERSDNFFPTDEAEGFRGKLRDRSLCLRVKAAQPKKKKMNRSFNKSQPLRNADCNAVEVKSKVGDGGSVWALSGRDQKEFACLSRSSRIGPAAWSRTHRTHFSPCRDKPLQVEAECKLILLSLETMHIGLVGSSLSQSCWGGGAGLTLCCFWFKKNCFFLLNRMFS